MYKIITVFVFMFFLSFSAQADGNKKNKPGVFKTSLSTLLVFSIPETLSWNPAVSTNISGVDFLENEIGVSVDQEALDAKDFIAERFGIDVDSLLAQGRVAFGLWELRPDVLCRARVLSGARVPVEGLPLRAGGHTLVVIDPEGIVMGGEFEGVTLAAGAAVGKGYWSIEKRNGKKLRLGWTSKIALHRPLSKTPLFYTDVWDLDSNQVGTGAGIDTTQFNSDFTFTPILRQVVELNTPEI
ncbi:MAG: hypothetical protein COA42_07735 [Alteromonadaceae bacterium]|nr:MAG: hypothetical protein COA42_07735 [Alteromonadaceae bacterium]